jgi:hypothetical protein
MVWGTKHIKSPPLSILHAFYRHMVSIMLQCAQVVFILKCTIAIGEGLFRLGVLSKGLSFSLFDMFLAIEGGLGT